MQLFCGLLLKKVFWTQKLAARPINIESSESQGPIVLVPLNETSQFNYYHSHFYFTFSLVIFF